MKTPGRGERPGGWLGRDVGPFLTIGLQLAISVALFFFVGYWLDGKFGTSPWGALGGAFIGVAGGLLKFLKEALALGKKADEKYHDEKARHED